MLKNLLNSLRSLINKSNEHAVDSACDALSRAVRNLEKVQENISSQIVKDEEEIRSLQEHVTVNRDEMERAARISSKINDILK